MCPKQKQMTSLEFKTLHEVFEEASINQQLFQVCSNLL